MKSLSRLALILLFAPVLAATAGAATLVHNVQGYTLDGGELRRFAALAFEGGRVTRLYATEERAAAASAETRIDGGGATLLPGLVDAHGHVSSLGRALASVDLVGAASEREAASRVKRYIEARPQADWVEGRGWNQVLWPGRAFPARASLDAVSGDQAVVLGRVDGHALWVNSRALDLAGIDAGTPDPEGGQILRDERGEPTGILIDNAMELVYAVMPQPSGRQLAQWQLRALEELASYGLTAVHDAGIPATEVAAYQSLRAAGRLPIRVYAMLDVRDPANDALIASGPLVDPEHRLDIRSVKISADGALGSRGAALLEGYSDAPDNRGLLLHRPGELEAHMNRAVAGGYQVNTHAIGDRANALVLDLYERLNSDPESAALRHRVEHAQVLRPADIARFPALDVIASVQPLHATSDRNMAGDRLGRERLRGAYAWRSLLESGARMAGGSDFPVESPNPFLGLHAAVTRQDTAGSPPGGWLPGQTLGREAALALFTEGAAYAAHQENALGRLLPGYFADFILVDGNYFEMPAADLWRLQVLATYVAGERVYGAGEH